MTDLVLPWWRKVLIYVGVLCPDCGKVVGVPTNPVASEPGATCPECGGHDDLPHDDIRAIMLALDISDHARPYSTHAVVHREILPAIRRLRGI